MSANNAAAPVSRRLVDGTNPLRIRRCGACELDSVISVGRIHVNYRVALFVRVPGRIDSLPGS